MAEPLGAPVTRGRESKKPLCIMWRHVGLHREGCLIGDVRFVRFYEALKASSDRSATLRILPDEAVIGALAAASRDQDPLLANILATEALNRTRRSRVVLNHMGEGVFVIDHHEVITYVNPPAERLLAAPASDMVGRLVDDVLQICDIDGTRIPSGRDIWGGVYATKQSAESEVVMFTRRTGETFPVSCTIAPIMADGEVDGIILNFRRVTSRRLADIRLRAGEDRIRSLTRHMVDAVACIDDDGIVTYASPAVLSIFGELPANIIGRPWKELVPLEASLGQDALGGPTSRLRGQPPMRAWDGTHLAVGKDGADVWVDIRIREARRVANERASSERGGREYVAVIRDVTQRELARRELVRSELHYRSLAETMAELVMLCEDTGRLVYVSPASQSLLGYEPDEMEGTSVLDLLSGRDIKRLRYELSTLPDGAARTVTTQIRCRDGSWKWFEASVSLTPDGTRPNLLVVARDVTGCINKDVQAVASKLTSDLLGEWPDPEAVLESVAPIAPTDSGAAMAGQQDVGDSMASGPYEHRPFGRGVEGSPDAPPAAAGASRGRGMTSSQVSFERMKQEARRLAQHLHTLAHCARAQRHVIDRQPVDLGRLAREVAEPFSWRDPTRQVELIAEELPEVNVDIELARVFFHMVFHQAYRDSDPSQPLRIALHQGVAPGSFILAYDAAPHIIAEEQRNPAAGPSMELTTAATIIGRHGGNLHVESKANRRRLSFIWTPTETADAHDAKQRVATEGSATNETAR